MVDINKIRDELRRSYDANIAPFVDLAKQYPKHMTIGALTLVLAGLIDGCLIGYSKSRENYHSGYSQGWAQGRDFSRPKSFEITRWGNEDLEDRCANPVLEIRMNAEGREIKLVLKDSTKEYQNPSGSGTVCVDTLVPDEPTPKASQKATKFGDYFGRLFRPFG